MDWELMDLTHQLSAEPKEANTLVEKLAQEVMDLKALAWQVKQQAELKVRVRGRPGRAGLRTRKANPWTGWATLP